MRRTAILTICFLMGLSLAAQARSEVVDRIVAVVNGEIITLSDLEMNIRPYIAAIDEKYSGMERDQAMEAMRKQMLENLINQKLLLAEAQRFSIAVSDVEVDNAIRMMREKNNVSEEAFLNQLLATGMSYEEYFERTRESILSRKLLGLQVRHKVVVTQEEVEAYYEENQADYGNEKRAHLALILLPPDKDAKDLKDNIDAGKITFESAAEKFSIGPGSDKGGDFGWFAIREMSESIREAISGLDKGGITEPFALEGRVALVKILELSLGDSQGLEDVQDEIFERLYEKKMEQRMAEYLDDLKARAIIDIRL